MKQKDARLEIIYKFLFNEKTQGIFGGPGSGRRPEGKNEDGKQDIVKADSPEVQVLMQKAKEGKAEVEKIGNTLADKFGGQITEIDFKTAESIARKANDFYGGNVKKVKDSIRNTVILEKQKIGQALEYAQKMPGYQYTNIRNPATDALGYRGIAVIYRLSNGLSGEVQINTPEIIYAKETESRARKMLGNEKYDEISTKIGKEGGLGHKLFEEWRSLKKKSDKTTKNQIEIQSREYYKNFFMAVKMENTYYYISEEIIKGRVVYFEWEFEEIAFKYVNDDLIEAKNKGYGGPFSVRYDTKLLAEAFLSNPKIITKEEYDRY